MRRAALPLLALALMAQAPAGDGDHPRKADPCAPHPQLYIAPMGEPFRAPAGGPAPKAAWFARADADRDGRVTLAEFLADATRFHAKLDTNHDGEIDPQEVIAYETYVAPEIRLFQRGAPLVRRHGKQADPDYYADALGAGRFAILNIPEPVSSADEDFNRGVSLQEFRDAAAKRFALLDTAQSGALTLATLALTPEEQQAQVCALKAAKKR